MFIDILKRKKKKMIYAAETIGNQIAYQNGFLDRFFPVNIH